MKLLLLYSLFTILSAIGLTEQEPSSLQFQLREINQEWTQVADYYNVNFDLNSFTEQQRMNIPLLQRKSGKMTKAKLEKKL